MNMKIKFKDIIHLFPSSQILYLCRADNSGIHFILEDRADQIKANKLLMFNISECNVEEINADSQETQCITLSGGREDF